MYRANQPIIREMQMGLRMRMRRCCRWDEYGLAAVVAEVPAVRDGRQRQRQRRSTSGHAEATLATISHNGM